ncbi:Hypothetical protein GbCGDNIH9_1237 [Granulibacter bethesdensis]|uniref:DUF3617 family protein n=2 Tax=Granulibacter bethesdensis TaxID=364410 RepID=A0AAC9KB26_9PROT|nr:Hypothetical protein GbCGDNIH9_1237 [Granulibacter bethesdensis]APH62120.1 Hypothetical protein GbCGDNIH8_1237 [Granulibacter bethesdensis]
MSISLVTSLKVSRSSNWTTLPNSGTKASFVQNQYHFRGILLMNKALFNGTAAFILSFCIGLPALARATEIQSGLWTIDITAQKDEKTVKRQKTQCITPEEAKNPEAGFNFSKSMPQCDNTHHWDGTTLSWMVECKNEKKIASSGKFVFDSATHLTGVIDNTQDGKPLAHITIDGRRTGECPKAP